MMMSKSYASEAETKGPGDKVPAPNSGGILRDAGGGSGSCKDAKVSSFSGLSVLRQETAEGEGAAPDLYLSNVIDGQACRPQGGEYVENINPATNTVISRIPRSRAEDVEAAVKAATGAFTRTGPTSWRSFSAAQRSAVLERMAQGIEARAAQLVQAEVADTGKSVRAASNVDIPRAASNLRFFASAILHDETGCHKMHDAINYTLRHPVGVFGLVTPWNLPLYLLTWKVGPCLAMGNTIVAKPSEFTPTTATLLAEIAAEAGLPDGVFNVVHGYGAECGQAIVEHPAVRGISFTGGTVSGAIVARTAAPLFKKLSLELGGKNATVVFADCDWEKTVAGAVRAGFLNNGQICLCGSRVLVERSVHDRFVKDFVAKVRETCTVGDPTDQATFLGSVISRAHRDKVESYIAQARELGGTIACGGRRPGAEDGLPAHLAEGAFLMPTVITGLPSDSPVATEEIFGPVVTIHAFDSDEEALAMANETKYGLAGSVWTTNLARAHRIAEGVTTGMIWINCWLHRDLRVPFGGVKESGVGREALAGVLFRV